MSKFYLNIFLGAGIGIFSFPTLSAENLIAKERDLPLSPVLRSIPSSSSAHQSSNPPQSMHGRKRSNSDDPIRKSPALLRGLQSAQKEKQSTLANYPKELTATQIESILNVLYLDKRSSTTAIELLPNLWVSIKAGDEAWRNLRKALHPTYTAVAKGATSVDYIQKNTTFRTLRVDADLQLSIISTIRAVFVDMIVMDYQGDTVKTQQNKGSKDVKGELARYRLMIEDAVLQYPVEAGGGMKMTDALLPLSFTFLPAKKERVEEKKEVKRANFSPPNHLPPPSPSGARAISKLPRDGLPLIPSAFKSKEKEKVGQQPLLSAPSIASGTSPDARPRAVSAPKPSVPKLLQKLKGAQADFQAVIREYPEKLIASQLELILNAHHDFERGSTVSVKLGPNFLISAKLNPAGLDNIKKAVSSGHIVDKIPFNLLRLASAKVSVYPQVVAYPGDYLQPVYVGKTVTTAQSKDSQAGGTLIQYLLKVGDEPLTYRDESGSKMITAILELSITRTNLESKK